MRAGNLMKFDEQICLRADEDMLEVLIPEDMFDGGEMLIPEYIVSLSVTLFSFNLPLEIGKYDAIPGIAGLFTIFLF